MNSSNIETYSILIIDRETKTVIHAKINDLTLKAIKNLNHTFDDGIYTLETSTLLCSKYLENLIHYHGNSQILDEKSFIYRRYYCAKLFLGRSVDGVSYGSGDQLDNNLITEYILSKLFEFEYRDNLGYLVRIYFRKFLTDMNNMHYSELEPKLTEIVQYMKRCTCNFNQFIIKDNTIFTKSMLHEILNAIKKEIYKDVSRKLYLIARMNILFLELEKNLYFYEMDDYNLNKILDL